MQCYKLVFSISHFVKNTGSIILISVFAVFSIFVVGFAIKGISALKVHISKMIFNEQNIDNKLTPSYDIKHKPQHKSTRKKTNTKKTNPPKKSKINNNNSEKDTKITEKKYKENKMNNIKIENRNRGSMIRYEGEIKYTNNELLTTKENNNQINTNNNINNENHIMINAGGVKSFYLNLYSSKKLIQPKPKEEEKPKKRTTRRKKNNYLEEKPRKLKSKEILESSFSMVEDPEPIKPDIILDDYELDHLNYLDALQLDKRNCCKIYCALLKREHNLLSLCFSCNDYNLFFAKGAKLLLNIATLMAMNAFLFADKSFHKFFMSGVNYYINYQILQISLSVIITCCFEILVCYLTFTDKYFYEIKALQKKETNGNKIFDILKCIRYKLLIFYVCTFILILFYWYFVSAFCAVYHNTLKNYLTDCAISFLIFSFIPFIIYGIIAILRTISLGDKNKKSLKCIYVISQTLPIIY